MPISLKAVNSSAPFLLESFSGQLTIATGATGDILTLTPASNKKVKLDALIAVTQQSGISVYRGAVKVVDNKSLLTGGTSPVANSFVLGGGMSSGTTGGGGATILLSVEGKINEVIRVVKESGSTTADIHYSFSTGI
jgi:hypothetical protein